MSDAPQGEGWWKASDDRWYPPEQHPDAAAAPPAEEPPPTEPTPAAAAAPAAPTEPAAEEPAAEEEPARGKGRLIAILVILLLLAAAVGAAIVLSGDDDDESTSTTEADIGEATGDRPDDGPIEFNTTYEDALEGSRTEARYTLDAPDGAMMTVTVMNDPDSAAGVLMNFLSEGAQKASFRVAPGSTEVQTVVLDHDGGAPFELVFTEGPAAYTFEVALEIQDDAGEGGDAGDEFSSAFSIDAGEGVTGLLGGDDQTDHYTLDLEPGAELTLEVTVDRESERAVLAVVELDGAQLFAERVQPGADTSFSLLLNAQDEGILDIIVSEGPADYAFTADFVEQEDGGEPGDAPSDLADARMVDPSSPLQGQVGNRDDADYFVFDAPAAVLQLTASADASSERAYSVTVEDQSGAQLGFFRVEPGAEQVESFEVQSGTTIRLIVGEGRAAYSIGIG